VLLTASVLALAGCASGEAAPAPAAAPTETGTPSASPSGPQCPQGPAGSDAFPADLPADFPADFPAPPGALDSVADDADPAVVAVRFPSTMSLSESVPFVLEQLPAAGFEIVGGDQEPHEADVVFARDRLRGQMRIARVDDCTTFWLVQVIRPTAGG
jgi:hypothetical protein